MASLLPFTAAPHRGVRGSFFTPQRPRNEFAMVEGEESDSELVEERSNTTGNIREIRYRGRGGALDDGHPSPLQWVTNYLNQRETSYIRQVGRVLRQPNVPAVNIWLTLSMTFHRPSPGVDERQVKNYATDRELVHDIGEARDEIKAAFLNLEKQVDEFVRKGSNWRVEKINESSVHIAKLDRGLIRHSAEHANLQRLRAGTHFPLPEWIRDKTCAVNPGNQKDDFCLAYCLEIALEEEEINLKYEASKKVNHTKAVNERTKARKVINDRARAPHATWPDIKWRINISEEIDFPVPITDLEIIEKANIDKRLALFVLTPALKKEDGLSWVYRSKYKGKEEPWKVFLLVDFHRKEHRLHFSYVRDVQRLIRENPNDNFRCLNCLQGFSREKQLLQHQEDRFCMRHDAMKTVFPAPEEAYYCFKQIGKKCPVDVVIVVDFECILQKRENEAHKVQRHVPSQAAVLSVCTFGDEEEKSEYLFNMRTGTAEKDFSYNENGDLESTIGEWCVDTIIDQRNHWINILEQIDYPRHMTPESEKRFQEETHCYGCGLPFDLKEIPRWMNAKASKKKEKREEKPEEKKSEDSGEDMDDNEPEEEEEVIYTTKPTDKVRDHDHRIEHDNFRHAMHNFCNLQYRAGWKADKRGQRKPTWGYVIPVLLHNFKGYDSHLILSSLRSVKGIRIIPQQGESILSMSFGNLLFLDSLSFLQSTLDSAVKNLVKSSPTNKDIRNNFTHLVRYVEDMGMDVEDERFPMLLRKGEFPYEYVDDPSKFDADMLPPASDFFSRLTGKNIEKKDYDHAQRFWQALDVEPWVNTRNGI